MSFRTIGLDRPTKPLEHFGRRFFVSMIMSWIFLFSLSFLTLPVYAYEKTDKTTDGQASDSHDERLRAHWNYMGVEGPEHWGMLSTEYMACEAGGRQSPIDIQMPEPGHHQETLIFRYKTSQIHELNDGHTIQVSHVSGCKVDLNKHTYKLRQFHFHEPSEHHIEGKAFPMEMHLVHQDARGHILVIAVMMEIGTDHPILAKLWNWLPKQMGKEVSIPLDISLRDILPTNTHHFSYSGSLTTPPCTEGVQWIVLTEPIKISEEDVRKFVAVIGHNARPVQPLGDRSIQEN